MPIRALQAVCSALYCILEILKNIKHSMVHAGFNNFARLGSLIPCFYLTTANVTFSRKSSTVHLKSIKAFKVTAIVLIVLIFVSPFAPLQNASALASVVQITSAKSSDGSDIPNGGTVKIPPGQSKVKVTFEYRGFDDNDHVLELRCSWDGVNYLKSNCSSESAESRSSFPGQDGVTRLYYVKTGTASRELQAPPVPRTYTFGVKVLNDNNNLSPAATWTFKMGASTNLPIGEGAGPEKPSNPPMHINVKVDFNSITVHNRHDDDNGEFELLAYVQGKGIDLTSATEDAVCGGNPPHCGGLYSVKNGQTFNFKPDTSISLYQYSKIPLAVFTLGIETDSCPIQHSYWLQDLRNIGLHPNNNGDLVRYIQPLIDPNYNWNTAKVAFNNFQNVAEEIMACSGYTYFLPWQGPSDPLGKILEIYNPINYGAGPHEVKSSSGDFTLRYTISVGKAIPIKNISP